jgi:pyruvate formate lyase activating enzyme
VKFKAWQKTSLIEYPGKLSTVLFVGGCNFRCPFCYNASLVLEPGSTPDLPGDSVLEYLREHRSLYQAVVVTGGEPTLHDALPSYLASVKSIGLLAGLETNGSRPGALRRLLEEKLVDFVAMDLKAPLTAAAYGRAAGLEGGRPTDRRRGELDAPEAAPAPKAVVEAVRESLGLLFGRESPEVELRCTVVPRLHQPRDLSRLAGQVVSAGFSRLVLQQFHPERALDPSFRDSKPYAPADLEALCRRLSRRGLACEARGL